MIGGSWTHRAARWIVRPLIGTWVRPNHLTTLRLVSGVAACVCLAVGTNAGMWWGGALWLVSAFLDRADGELARIGDMMTAGGHAFDYHVDIAVNATCFVAIGIGLRHGWLGPWSVPLGLISGGSLVGCAMFSEWLEARSPPGTRAYAGKWGFDPDDALYLIGPLAWVGWLDPILIGASLGATAVMVVTGIRLRRMVPRQVGSARARARPTEAATVSPHTLRYKPPA